MDLPEVKTRISLLRQGNQVLCLNFWREKLFNQVDVDSLERLSRFVESIEAKERGKQSKRAGRFKNRAINQVDWRVGE